MRAVSPYTLRSNIRSGPMSLAITSSTAVSATITVFSDCCGRLAVVVHEDYCCAAPAQGLYPEAAVAGEDVENPRSLEVPNERGEDAEEGLFHPVGRGTHPHPPGSDEAASPGGAADYPQGPFSRIWARREALP